MKQIIGQLTIDDWLDTLALPMNHICAQYKDMCNIEEKRRIAEEIGDTCTGFCCGCVKRKIDAVQGVAEYERKCYV